MIRRPDPPSFSDLRPLFQGAVEHAVLPEPVDRLLARMPDATERAERTKAIRAALLARSATITHPQFHDVAEADLYLLFDLLDASAFQGCLSELVAVRGLERVGCRLSNRMRSSGGLTEFRRRRRPDGSGVAWIGVAISRPVLRAAFPETGGTYEPAVVVGLPCHDRLDVLLRVFEHELVHVFEKLVDGRTSCSAAPFKALANGLFGHLESVHRVVPAHVRAARESGLRPGDRVRFGFEGRTHEGVVRRITRRATVLVRDRYGRPYTDGHTYRKYYVPLPMLERV